MKNVRMLTTAAGPDGAWRAGDVLVMSNSEADLMRDRGLVEIIGERTDADPPVPDFVQIGERKINISKVSDDQLPPGVAHVDEDHLKPPYGGRLDHDNGVDQPDVPHSKPPAAGQAQPDSQPAPVPADPKKPQK